MKKLVPRYRKSNLSYYDKKSDTIYAPDSTGEFYKHELFHARPDSIELDRLKPFYENLNDDRLLLLGADLSFVKLSGDPGVYYSPEELGARVLAARYMLKKNGINNINNRFLDNIRKSDRIYGDNFRDLLHMYNNDNLIKIFGNRFYKGGKL